MRVRGQRAILTAMEVRTATILFTDIVSSTELLVGACGSLSSRLLQDHLDLVEGRVVHRGGRLVKRLGDGVMAWFACAGSAVAGGCDIQAAVARLDEAPAIRIGVSSGDVTVADDEDCYGTAVVEASRICDTANGGQLLISEATRRLLPAAVELRPLGDRSLKGVCAPMPVWEIPWATSEAAPVTAVIADDALLVREGVSRLLQRCGIHVLAEAGDGEELTRLTECLHPDVVIVDIRMPPSFTCEGLDAAERILAEHPLTGILVLSQDMSPGYAARLRSGRSHGVGYLLKERVGEPAAFEQAVRTVACGGLVFDPELM